MKRLVMTSVVLMSLLAGCGGSDGNTGIPGSASAQDIVIRSETFNMRECQLRSSAGDYYQGILILSGQNASVSFTLYEDSECRFVKQNKFNRTGRLTEVITLPNGLQASVLPSDFGEPLYLVFQDNAVLVFLEPDDADFLIYSKEIP